MSETEPKPSAEEARQPLSTAQLAASGNGQGTPDLATEDKEAPLLASEESRDFQGRWDGIQASFVDEPRKSVQEADTLVASAMKRLAEVFADERGKLEGQWDRGDDVSTEELRVALRRYRTFFGRLLAV